MGLLKTIQKDCHLWSLANLCREVTRKLTDWHWWSFHSFVSLWISAYKLIFICFRKCTCFKRIVSCSEIIFRAKNFEEVFCRQSDTLAKVPEEENWENGHYIICSVITSICLVLADLIFVKKIQNRTFWGKEISQKCVVSKFGNFQQKWVNTSNYTDYMKLQKNTWNYIKFRVVFLKHYATRKKILGPPVPTVGIVYNVS